MKIFLIAFLAGAVSATGFAPLGLWPLTLAALALLIALTINAARMRGAFALGWGFGAGQFVIGLNWIATAFTYQAAMPAWFGWIGVVLLSLFLAIYPGIAAALAWRAGKGAPPIFVLVFAAAWILTEYLRAVLFSGFAWNPLAAILMTDIDSGVWQRALPASARWIGTYGLSGLLILAGGAIFLAFAGRWRSAGAMLAPTIVFAALGALDMAPEQGVSTSAMGDSRPAIRVIQPNIDQAHKWDAEFAARNFARLAERTGATGDRPRLIFWPEAAVPDYIESDPFARSRIAALLGRDDVLMLGATQLIVGEGEDGRPRITGAHNSLYAIDARGVLLDRYDKAHLVPFGEYLPMRPLLSAIGLSRLAPGDLDFSRGPGPQTIDLPGFGRAGGQICYEMIFSGQVIDAANRPDFIFNPSNDAWFGAWGPPQHLAQARLRAIEEAMPIIRSTPTGISAVIDAGGAVTHSIPFREAGTIDATLPRAGPPTLFSRFGNVLPMVFAALLAMLAAAIGARRRG